MKSARWSRTSLAASHGRRRSRRGARVAIGICPGRQETQCRLIGVSRTGRQLAAGGDRDSGWLKGGIFCECRFPCVFFDGKFEVRYFESGRRMI